MIKITMNTTKININKKNPGFDFNSFVEVNISEHLITSTLIMDLLLSNLVNKSIWFFSNLFNPGFILQSH